MYGTGKILRLAKPRKTTIACYLTCVDSRFNLLYFYPGVHVEARKVETGHLRVDTLREEE